MQVPPTLSTLEVGSVSFEDLLCTEVPDNSWGEDAKKESEHLFHMEISR
jgi:hypothetical protein